MNPIHVPATSGGQVSVLGTAMLIRVHGRATNGTLAVVETHDAPGGGPPLHVHHREDETFQVLAGEYEFTVAGKTIVARSGDTLFAPRGIPHTYRYRGEQPGRLLCVITPAGFERFFEEVSALGLRPPADIPRVLEIAQKFGLEILPPSGG